MDTTIDITKDLSKIKATGYLKTTMSQLYRTNGNTAQAKGVQPDIELPDLLQVQPQREADEPNVLISVPIPSSKFFKPAAPLLIKGLQAAAKIKTDASPYFVWLKKYMESEKVKTGNKEINLKLSEVIEQENKKVTNIPDSNAIKNQKLPFTIEPNSFEKQQMQVNTRLKEMNGQWTAFLSKDPYLHVAYDIMLLMIK
jgi:carboxyl-terminal processing protease